MNFINHHRTHFAHKIKKKQDQPCDIAEEKISNDDIKWMSSFFCFLVDQIDLISQRDDTNKCGKLLAYDN